MPRRRERRRAADTDASTAARRAMLLLASYCIYEAPIYAAAALPRISMTSTDVESLMLHRHFSSRMEEALPTDTPRVATALFLPISPRFRRRHALSLH